MEMGEQRSVYVVKNIQTDASKKKTEMECNCAIPLKNKSSSRKYVTFRFQREEKTLNCVYK